MIIASHAFVLHRLLPTLPALHQPSRSPSSDVLLGALPLAHAAERLDALARTLPNGPGVVVAHAPADAITSAYFVITMRLWPRPVSLVACEPTPRFEQFRVPYTVLPPAWRIDLTPHSASPLSVGPAATPQAATLCAAGRAR